MKKTLVSIVIILALAVMAFGVLGTGAWFTDSAQINNNYITTGSLDLKVTGGPFTGKNLEPGADYRSLGIFCVENIGQYDMKWRGWVVDLSDAKNLSGQLLVKVVMNPDGTEWNYGPPNKTLFEDIPFSSIVGVNDYLVLNDPDYPFKPGDRACYNVQASLPSTVGNNLQSARLDANFYIQGTQYINTGWDE